jgi:hypothetical protein
MEGIMETFKVPEANYCKHIVKARGETRNCWNPVWNDGWCRVHHPGNKNPVPTPIKDEERRNFLEWLMVSAGDKSLPEEVSSEWEAWVARPCVDYPLAPREARALLEWAGRLKSHGITMQRILNILLQNPRCAQALADTLSGDE